MPGAISVFGRQIVLGELDSPVGEIAAVEELNPLARILIDLRRSAHHERRKSKRRDDKEPAAHFCCLLGSSAGFT